jgi:hypothetical protein
MRVDIHKARSGNQPARIDLLAAALRDITYGGDAAILNGDISIKTVLAGTVDNGRLPDHNVHDTARDLLFF